VPATGSNSARGSQKGEWIAWRCVTSPQTCTRYLLEVHSSGPLPDAALAGVAASGKRFAR
jgi:hypothetical protein